MEEKKVYLLYEGNEWLSKDSLVLMGVFTSEESLKKNAKKLVRQRAKKHLGTAEANSIYEFENPGYDDNSEEIEVVVNDIMAELMNNHSTNGWEVNYIIKEVQTDELEEI